MKKKIKIDLSTNSIEKLIKRLQEFQKDISNADEKIVDKLSELGLQEIQNNYSQTGYKDGNEDVGFFQVGSKTKRKIGVSGTQVLYNEFGTGTLGAESPHPEKDNYSLNAYNNRNGTTIRENKNENSIATKLGVPVNGLYWTYNNNGIKVYTQGIPAGKQVYNAKKAIEEQKEKIIKEVVGDALSKL